ncbi:MAG: hypothetical protein HY434_00150 [Candidatus Liptonbacteria bacterium]|nr:hypothetical protein [Candidatus Liptonbacteria bacterium]
MGARIASIFFLVIALGAGLYFFRSGALSTLHFPTKPFSLFGATSSRQTYSWQPEGGVGALSPSQWIPGGSQIQPNYSGSGAINPQDIPEGFTASKLSPHFHKIRIGSVSPGSDSYYGQISLSANFGGGDSVNVSGWYFQANKGSQFVPKAVNVYDPSGLTLESDIVLRSGDTLNMYSTQSAIGENLRLNKCIGYLENSNHFMPSLPLSCPSIDRSEISGFSGACQDVILSVGSCKLPPSNPKLPPDDYACRSFLNTINYRGCFEKHRNDPDFLSREWRAWTNSRFLDARHDTILLFDRQGLLVDKYSY